MHPVFRRIGDMPAFERLAPFATRKLPYEPVPGRVVFEHHLDPALAAVRDQLENDGLPGHLL